MSSPVEWYRDNYLISTNPSLIQPKAVNTAFASDGMYWIKPMEEPLLKKMLDSSLCFGVYELPKSSAELAGRSNPRQVGLGRVVTDYVSFAYLTDVYIMEEFQGKGLGKWLIECVNKELSSWPQLRWLQLFSTGTEKFYEKRLSLKIFEQGKDGLMLMARRGPGSFQHD